MYRRNDSSRGVGQETFGAPRLSKVFDRLLGRRAATPDDMELVNRAAETAAINEFDFFQAAWQQWNGSRPEPQNVEPIFARYLRDGKAPGFVRHYARRVLNAALDGEIDPVALGLVGYRRREGMPDLSCRFSTELWSCVLFASLVIMF